MRAPTTSRRPLVRRLSSRACVVLAVAWVGAGCSSTESTIVVQTDSNDVDTAGPDAGRGGRGPDTTDPATPPDATAGRDAGTIEPDPPATLDALLLDPTEIVLRTRLGASTSATPAVSGRYSDGTVGGVFDGVRWFLERTDAATVDAFLGTLTATGRGYGSFVFGVRATEGSELEARGRLLVQLVSERTLDDLPETTGDRFDAAPLGESGAGAQILYPLDGTMYPSGIRAPLIQWTSTPGDLHRVTISVDEDLQLSWVTASARLAIEADAWEAMTSVPRLPLRIAVDTLRDETLLPGDPITFTIADAALGGEVYYWQVETGDIMRIPEGADAPLPLFPDNATSGTCRGCHTLSRDGGRIGFMYNGGDNPRAGLAWIGNPDPPIVANGGPVQWNGLSFDPGGTRAAASFFGSLFLADTTPGLPEGIVHLGPLGDANTGGRLATHPAWSPDGSRLAWIHRDNGVDWSYESGRMYMMNRDLDSGTFGPSRVVVPSGETPETDTVSYPSWSPDSRWVAYSLGPDNRGTAPATIWLVDPDSGEQVHLARANPTGQDVLPSFSPYIEGGYYWLLFYSTRPYGNVTTTKQLWVAAIDTDIVPGVDASYPAFWLPGQDPTRANITAAWAPPACTSEGDPCKSEDECCSGLACEAPPGGGDPVCVTSACTLAGARCATTDDCCPGDLCLPDRDGNTVCQIGFGR